MSIGSYSVLLRSSVKVFVKSTYFWSGGQVQQLFSKVLAVGVAAVLAISLSLSEAQAGALGTLPQGQRSDFYDWEFAKKVWLEMNTWEAEEKEWAKYAADFDPWLAEWKKNNAKAKALLKTYSEEKRKNIERAYDMQVVWDVWYNKLYFPWVDDYRGTVTHSPRVDLITDLLPFDQYVAQENRKRMSALPNPCVPQNSVLDCGPWPNWRSDDMKAEERKLEALRKKRLGH